MKSYTNLGQSKELAKILPIESADMRYAPFGDTHPWVWDGEFLEKDSAPCWSLAALIGVLPVMIIRDYNGSLIRLRIYKGNVSQDEYAIWYDDLDNGLSTDIASESKNLVDACYEMIIKLHELNLL